MFLGQKQEKNRTKQTEGMEGGRIIFQLLILVI